MNDFSLWRLGALVGSLIPGVVFAVLLLRVGHRRMSWRLLGVSVAAGAMIAILPLTVGLLEPATRVANPLYAFLAKAFAYAGLSEEGGKLIACWFIVRTHFERRGRADFILGCAAVGLGFALIENISYVFRAPEEWKAIALSRAVSSVPIHAFQGFAMGVGLELAERSRRRIGVIALTWVGVAILHGLYDFPLFLAEISPLAPNEINAVAAFLGVWTPTLLAAMFLSAVSLVCFAALLGSDICRKDATRSDNPQPARALAPPWVDRLVYSNATGLIVGGVLLLLAGAALLIGVFALLSGALPSQLLNGGSVCVIVGATGWAFGQDGLRDAGAVWRRARSAFVRFSQRQPLAGVASLGAGAAAGFAAVYWSIAGFRYAVAFLLVMSGGTLASFGELRLAMANYATALAYQPDMLLAILARADIHRTKQNYDEALNELENAVDAHPKEPVVYAARGAILGEKHEHAKALVEFDKAIALDDENAGLFVARGGSRVENRDFDGALADAETALRLSPKLAAAHTLRAYVYLEQDNISGALGAYNAAIEANPKDVSAYFARGRLKFETGDFKAAVADLRNALKGPDRRNYVLLWLFMAAGRMNEDPRREVAMWAGSVARDAWPFPVIEMYLGGRKPDDVQKAAVNADQRCEFDFYAGELLMIANFPSQAGEAFRRAVANCPREFIETRVARSELAALTKAAKAAGEASPETAVRDRAEPAAPSADRPVAPSPQLNQVTGVTKPPEVERRPRKRKARRH